ncbi:hypothetical protein BGZ96_010448 [Linnemannia gamsii]|uniref:Extracellular membrane protein CFEM domain-containing protein n=1 Tax=Linnemannia gamsii TaxID=64522 RepID=A0ABQ7JUC9_9FUNG|nr:hypothetical protein BGZ96_010448 [Linnemannia gamsii]
MHFSITVASVFAIVLAAISVPISVVSAQAVPVTDACIECASDAAGKFVPSNCTPALLLTNNEPAHMTPQEKTCFCSLSRTTIDWLQTCVKPGACTLVNINNLYSNFAAPEFRDVVCSTGGIVPPSAPSSSVAPPTAPSSSVAPVPRPPSATSSVPTLTLRIPAAPSSTTSGTAGARFGGSSKTLTGLTVVIVAVAGALL